MLTDGDDHGHLSRGGRRKTCCAPDDCRTAGGDRLVSQPVHDRGLAAPSNDGDAFARSDQKCIQQRCRRGSHVRHRSPVAV